jgi:hypothetical protein
MTTTPRPLRRTEAVAREAQRWREVAREWVHPSVLPATREQLSAHLIRENAPSWLVWRINARLHPHHVFASVEEVVALGAAPQRRKSSPGLPYAG